MKHLATLLIVLICIGSISCGGGGSNKSSTPSQNATVSTIAVGASSLSVVAGQTIQLTAIATYNDNSTKDVTTTATWKSSDSTVATISASGLVTTLKAGQFTAAANFGSISGTSKTITVSAATLASITLSPSSASVSVGQTKQLKATGTYTDGSTQDLTSTVTWTSTNTSIATVNSSGLVTGVAAGNANISAASGSVNASAVLVVTSNPAPSLSSILITPGSPSVVVGATKQLQATGTYSDGSTKDLTSSVTWTSNNQSVATVSAAGLVSGMAAGSATITAVYGSLSATAAITVTTSSALTLSSIAITPSSATLGVGQVKQLAATGTYTDSSTQNLTSSVTWSSSNQSVAAVDTSGVVTAASAGLVTITATSGSVNATATITVTTTVLSSIVVTPTSASIATGQTQQFAANGIFSDGSAVDITNSVVWGSDTPGVATVNTAGLASGVSAGTANISAASGSIVGSASLAVTSATLLSIDISPDEASTQIGGQVQYVVTGTFSDTTTQDLKTATYTSSDPTIATIDPSTGVAIGMASSTTPVTITATVGTLTNSTTLTVLSPTLDSISLSPASATLAKGITEQLVLTGLFTDGNTEPLTQGVIWGSSDASIASIDQTGLVTAVSAGQATLTAAYMGKAATATVTVDSPALLHISVTPGTATLGIGGTQQFSATAVFADGSTQDVTSQAEWVSSSATVAFISNSGLANALSMGTAQISAVFQGVTGSATINVTSAKLVSISVTPSNPIVPMRMKVQFTAIGTFSDGTTLPLSGVYWRSSAANRANINGSGLARIKKSGTVTISATLNGITGKTTVTVTSSSLSYVTVTPDVTTIAQSTAQQFKLIGTFADGTTVDLSKSAYWQTSNYHYAVISSSGLATGVAPDLVTITGSFRGLTDNTTLTVSSASIVSIAVTPASASIALGSSQPLTATGTFNDGSSQDITSVVQWRSADPAIAVVNATGLATSAGRGTTSINATFKSATGSASLTVN